MHRIFERSLCVRSVEICGDDDDVSTAVILFSGFTKMRSVHH
jgi:hypothetical protein